MAIQALAGGRGVAPQRGVVRALAVIVALGALGLPACFYVDEINQRPSIDIRQQSSDEVYRGSSVSLTAVDNDPEGQLVLFGWRAYVCDDANDQTTCDDVPFYTGELRDATFAVPPMRLDAPVPVESVLVILQAQDDHGAIARPDSRLIIPVSDHPPVLDMSMTAPYQLVVDHEVQLFARVSDVDDEPPTNLTVDWNVYTPMTQPAYELEDIDVLDPDPMHELQLGKKLTPHGVGSWQVEVVVTDPRGAQATATQMFDIVPDHAPCLRQWAPITAPAGDALPVSDPTLLQVTVVSDDLDPYPRASGDTTLGVTSFAWSVKQPGASTRTPLPTSGNSLPFDPGSYAPGDIVEVRVEISDRIATPVNCADDQLTCSTISMASCNQRLTWRLEVR